MPKTIKDLENTLDKIYYLYTLENVRNVLEQTLAQDLETLKEGQPIESRVSPLDSQLNADIQPDRPQFKACEKLYHETEQQCKKGSLDEQSIARRYFKMTCDAFIAQYVSCKKDHILYGRTNTLIRDDNHAPIAQVVEILSGTLLN